MSKNIFKNNVSISDTRADGKKFENDKQNGSTSGGQTAFNENGSMFTGQENGRDLAQMLADLSPQARADAGLGSIYSIDQYRALIILHELIHANDKTGKYNDIDDLEKSIDIDRMLTSSCDFNFN